MADFVRRRPSFIDENSGAAIGITVPHHEIHEASAFSANFVDESPLADNDTIILAFKTPAAPVNAHMVVEFSTLAGGDLDLWEAADWTEETGTEVAIINLNRNGTPPSSGILADQAQAAFVAANVMHANPTGLNVGSATSIQHLHLWGSQAKLAGQARGLSERVLKPDTQYAAVFTADGANNKAQVVLTWYEHTDRSQ